MKKFFKKTEGFTLVELIVVIAILGILAGVGTVGYSGYIKKANMAADQQLVSNIENALALAGYNGTFNNGEGGYIVLTVDGVSGIEAGSSLEKAMVAAFGANYADVLKLKYNGWSSNGLYTNLTPETAFAVANSSYLTGLRSNDLLKDVETMTGMAMNLVTVLGSGGGFTEGMTLSGMFTKDGTCVIDATAAKYGITKDANETWEQWAAKSDANNATYSNLLVMTAADESEKYMGGVLGTGAAYEMSGASNMILEFSAFYAYAAINPEFSNSLDKYMEHLDGTGTVPGLAPVTNASTGAAWYRSLTAAAGPGYADYIATMNDGGQAFMDQVGFLSIMGGIGNPSEEQAKQVAAGLNQTDLFTNGVVNNMYNDYMDGVAAMSGTYDPDGSYADWTLGLEDGAVAVFYLQKDGQNMISNSLPTA